MLELDFFSKSEFFSRKEVKSGEIVFNEGDIDNNIYIIESGEFDVEKYTTSNRDDFKLLATLGNGDFFGESSLNGPKPKEARIIAKTDGVLHFIDVVKNLEKFLNIEAKKGFCFLKYLVNIGNKRLLETNSQITAIYEMDKSIGSIEKVDCRNIASLFGKLKLILDCDYIIFLRKSPVSNTHYIIRYDSRNNGKMLNEVIEFPNEKFSLREFVNLDKFNYYKKLNVGNRDLGFLVIGKKDRNFLENEKKIISSISTSLSGVLHMKELIDEQKDQNYLRDD